MKHLFFLLIASVLVIAGCDKDDLDFDYDPGVMHFDGPNANSPALPAGTNEAAAKFSSGVLDLYEGKQIESVEIYIYNVPDDAELRIYGRGESDEPGSILYQQDISTELDSFQWNSILLDTPFAIPESGEIWISMRMTQSDAIQVIGCDAGPNKKGGDWVFENTQGVWQTFRQLSPADNINWNIRAEIF